MIARFESESGMDVYSGCSLSSSSGMFLPYVVTVDIEAKYS